MATGFAVSRTHFSMNQILRLLFGDAKKVLQELGSWVLRKTKVQQTVEYI